MGTFASYPWNLASTQPWLKSPQHSGNTDKRVHAAEDARPSCRCLQTEKEFGASRTDKHLDHDHQAAPPLGNADRQSSIPCLMRASRFIGRCAASPLAPIAFATSIASTIAIIVVRPRTVLYCTVSIAILMRSQCLLSRPIGRHALLGSVPRLSHRDQRSMEYIGSRAADVSNSRDPFVWHRQSHMLGSSRAIDGRTGSVRQHRRVWSGL